MRFAPKKSAYIWAQKNVYIPKYFYIRLNSNKHTEVLEVAYYCNFTALKNDCWFGLPEIGTHHPTLCVV